MYVCMYSFIYSYIYVCMYTLYIYIYIYIYICTHTHIYIYMYVCIHIHCCFLFSPEVMSYSLDTPWTLTHQSPQSMGFPRQVFWSGLPFPFPGDLPNWGIEQYVLHWQADSLPLSHLGSPSHIHAHICISCWFCFSGDTDLTTTISLWMFLFVALAEGRNGSGETNWVAGQKVREQEKHWQLWIKYSLLG